MKTDFILQSYYNLLRIYWMASGGQEDIYCEFIEK